MSPTSRLILGSQGWRSPQSQNISLHKPPLIFSLRAFDAKVLVMGVRCWCSCGPGLWVLWLLLVLATIRPNSSCDDVNGLLALAMHQQHSHVFRNHHNAASLTKLSKHPPHVLPVWYVSYRASCRVSKTCATAAAGHANFGARSVMRLYRHVITVPPSR